MAENSSLDMGRMGKMADENKELIVTRIFDAPRELVLEAYTDSKSILLLWESLSQRR